MTQSEATKWEKIEGWNNLLLFLVFVLCLLKLFPVHDWLPLWVEYWRRQKQVYTIDRMSLLMAFTPTIFSIVVSFAITQFFEKPNLYLKLLVGIMTVCLGVRYMAWRFFATLNLDNVVEGIFSVLFFVSEFIMMIDTVSASSIQCILSTDRSAEADKWSEAVISRKFMPSVDVLIPSYNEPEDVLRRTIIGCQAMDYPNKKIYLLDDTRRPHIRKMTEELGCYYLDRPDNKHAKAGNINNALKHIDSELVTIFDADFVPCTNYLTRLVGFFQDPGTALVQTPQHFYSPDPIEVNLGLSGGISNEQTFFFRHIQPSRDVFNAIICCGTSYVIRRSALDEIGGIPTESITEDYFTSVKLEAKGHRLKYLNEALSAGEAPANIGAYIDQRLRWGQGTIQCLFCYHNALTVPGLNLIQRYYFFSATSYWFMSVFRLILFCGPLFYLIFGLNPLRATLDGIFYYFFPYYVLNIVLFTWLNNGRRSVFWSNIYEALLCLPMAKTVFYTLISPFAKGFKVTPKGLEANQLEINWILVKPLVVLMGLYLFSCIIKLGTMNWENNPEPVYVNLCWAIYNVLIFWISVLACMDVPKRKYVSFKHEIDYSLKVNGEVIQGKTVRLAERDALLEIPHKLDGKLAANTEGLLSLPDLQIYDLLVKIQDKKKNLDEEARHPNKLFLEIDHIKLEDERKLIKFLYCRPGQWEEKPISESTYFSSFIQSIFRMNPLANG